MATTTDASDASASFKELKLEKLTVEQVRHIDQVLASLSEYGEVHLIVQHGQLRYINKVESFKACQNELNK